MKAYCYLRTSADDRDKAGIPVQREGCVKYSARAGYEIVREFVDDGVTGTLPMDMRPFGAQLVRAIADNGVQAVLVYNGERVGREQPVFWAFIGLCRAKHIAVIDASGNDLTDSLQGGINGLLAEMDRRKIVDRLAAGKHMHRGAKRVDGRHPFGEHPSREFDWEREIVRRIRQMHTDGRMG